MAINLIAPDLTTYQKEGLYAPERFTIIEACTKSGKTFSHIWWLFEQAHKGKENHEFWWVAPVYQQAKIAFNRMRTKVQGLPQYKINLSDLTIKTPLGTVIAFKSADNPNNLYGEDVYAIVFDEFTRAKSAAWASIRSTLTYTKGKCKFIGNFIGNGNWGHLLGKRALTDPEYSYFKWTAKDAIEAGILDSEEVEQARKDLPSQIFKALYMVEGDADDTVLFHTEKILDLFTNTFVKQGKKYLSCDIATHGSDRFVVGYWEGLRLIKIYAIDKCDAKEVEEFIKSKAENHGVTRSNIIYDADGIGGFLRGYLHTAKGFNNGGIPIRENKKQPINYQNLKAQCYYTLSTKLEEIYIEDEDYRDEIVMELESIKKVEGTKWSVTKKDHIKDLIGRSPDFADMLMMRMFFEINPYKGSFIE